MSHLVDAPMSKPRKPSSNTDPSSIDAVSHSFRSSLTFDTTNKPDSKDFLDLSSPVSPLQTARPAAAGAITVTTSTSSSSSGSLSAKLSVNAEPKRSDLADRRTRSGDFLLGSGDQIAVPDARSARKPGHRRSGSVPVIYTGTSFASSATTSSGSVVGSTATSSLTTVLPAGNICPSGKIGTGIMGRTTARHDVLGSGTGNYGHGSIVRGGGVGGGPVGSGKPPEVATGNGVDSVMRRAMVSVDLEEVKRVANEQYKRGQFAEALRLYDRAIAMCPDNAVCRSNRAAALTGLRRLGEAVKECEEALRLDPGFARAHQRLASLHIRLGQIESARKHLALAGTNPDPVDLLKMEVVERHLNRCAESRKVGDWRSVLRESDMAVAEGADSSSLLLASKAEALLRTHHIEDADLALSNAFKIERSCMPSPNTKFFGMESNSYLYYVRSQLDMALGRFDNAVAAAEKARQIDSVNVEVKMMLSNVKIVARSRSLGNELFNSGKFTEACLAYGEGLKYDPSNSVLFCNRAVCRSKLGQWQKSIDDCNEALRIHPNYSKALLRRAASYCKLEQWTEAVKDYEVLRKEFPGDTEVAEALLNAQVALKTSRGEEISNLKFSRDVKEITGVEQFKKAIVIPGVSIVHFMTALNHNCNQIAPLVNTLCTRYPSVNFLKVDVNEIPAVAKLENVRIVPTFKIYKNGTRVKEMVCPSQQVLDNSVRHYAL